MNTLHIITRNEVKAYETVTLLVSACESRNIRVNIIITEDFDFWTPQALTEQDWIYNTCDDLHSQLVEKFLLNHRVKSFYKSYTDGINKIRDVDDIYAYFLHRSLGIPSIPTILLTTHTRDSIKRYVQELWGFPIILKAPWWSCWVWVMKIESLESLYSIIDYLRADYKENVFLLKKYIHSTQHARVIVIGQEVAWCIEYQKSSDDFRTNVSGSIKTAAIELPEHVHGIAIKAVNDIGYSFWWVDILFDEKRNPFVAEVNFPCDYPWVERETGVPVATKMIDFLFKNPQ